MVVYVFFALLLADFAVLFVPNDSKDNKTVLPRPERDLRPRHTGVVHRQLFVFFLWLLPGDALQRFSDLVFGDRLIDHCLELVWLA